MKSVGVNFVMVADNDSFPAATTRLTDIDFRNQLLCCWGLSCEISSGDI